MADMKQLTINETTYDLVDDSAMHFQWDAIGNLNAMPGFMGRISEVTLNRPNDCLNGMVLRLKHSDLYEQQYILAFSSPGRVYSRVKSNGTWLGWKYVSVTTDVDTYTGTTE